MKKHQPRQRKLRKCERGIRTKSLNQGCRWVMSNRGLVPRSWYNRDVEFNVGWGL